MTVHASASIRAGLFDGDEHAELALAPDRLTYVQVLRGEIDVNGERLEAGDAVKLQRETGLSLAKGVNAEVLVFDLSA